MTVGEKILFYRKKIGLSQEELGQKMLVSRQTISLWEMDKTLPTIENLIRLKEIFAVSIDDILSESAPVEPREDEAKETYVFQFAKSDLKNILLRERLPLIRRAVNFVLWCIALVVFVVVAEAPNSIFYMLVGGFVFGIVSYVNSFLLYRKAWKSSENRLYESTYRYQIYDSYFVLNIFRGEEVTKTLKVYFDDIEKVQSLDKYMILHVSGERFIIKKDVLMANSVFLPLGHKVSQKEDGKIKRIVLTIIPLFLFVFFIAAIFGIMLLNNPDFLDNGNRGILYMFLFISVVFFMISFYSKKGDENKKKGRAFQMLNKLAENRKWIIIAFAAILLVFWLLYLLFYSGEDKVSGLISTPIFAAVLYGFMWLMFKICEKNASVKAMVVFFWFCFIVITYVAVTNVVRYIQGFPQALENLPVFGGLIGALIALLAATKRIVDCSKK